MKDYCDCGNILMHNEKDQCLDCYSAYRREEKRKEEVVPGKGLETKVQQDSIFLDKKSEKVSSY